MIHYCGRLRRAAPATLQRSARGAPGAPTPKRSAHRPPHGRSPTPTTFAHGAGRLGAPRAIHRHSYKHTPTLGVAVRERLWSGLSQQPELLHDLAVVLDQWPHNVGEERVALRARLVVVREVAEGLDEVDHAPKRAL